MYIPTSTEYNMIRRSQTFGPIYAWLNWVSIASYNVSSSIQR